MSDTLVNVLGLTIGWGFIAVGVLLMLRALFADRSRGRRRCPRCWYSMEGVPGMTCPECGRTARKERRLFKTRRRWRMAFAGSLLPLVGLGVLYTSGVVRLGWYKAVPTTLLVAICPIQTSEWMSPNISNRFVWPSAAPGSPAPQPAQGAVILPSFPSVTPGPQPAALPAGNWRDSLVNELRARVDADMLWDWQAAILVERIRQAAVADGQTIGVFDTRGVIDTHPLKGSPSPASRRRVLRDLCDSFPIVDVRQLLETHDSPVFSLAPPNPPAIIGPCLITWTRETSTEFKELFAALSTCAPGAPEALEPDDWDRRVHLLHQVRTVQVNAPSDRRLDVFLLDLMSQSMLPISPDWESLQRAGITKELVLRTPFEPSGSVAELLGRCSEAAKQERGLRLQWSIGAHAIEVRPQLPLYGIDVPGLPRYLCPVTRVYDTRSLPALNLNGWNMDGVTFDGCLIVKADTATHVAFETYLATLRPSQ